MQKVSVAFLWNYFHLPWPIGLALWCIVKFFRDVVPIQLVHTVLKSARDEKEITPLKHSMRTRIKYFKF